MVSKQLTKIKCTLWVQEVWQKTVIRTNKFTVDFLMMYTTKFYFNDKNGPKYGGSAKKGFLNQLCCFYSKPVQKHFDN